MIGWQWSIGVTNINNFILKTYKTNQRNAFYGLIAFYANIYYTN